MADPNDYVPDYDDPIPILDEMLMPDGSLGVEYEGLYDQPSKENRMYQLGHDHPIGKNIMLNEDTNQFGHGTSQAGTTRANDQVNEYISENFNPEISDCGNPIQIPEWPIPAEPYACSCCQVLREIIHTIGMYMRI